MVNDNGCLSYGYVGEGPEYPAMIVSPVDYLKGWVKERSQAFETLQGRFRDVSLLDNEQLANNDQITEVATSSC